MDIHSEVKDIDKKLFLFFGTITSVITVLLASIAVLLELHWSLVLFVGLIVGVSMSFGHNWFVARLANKYSLDTAPNLVEKIFKPQPKPVTALVAYVEPEPAKDPWIHDCSPEDFK